MSNLQVMYVDVCQRSRSVPITYASVCVTCVIRRVRRQIFNMQKISRRTRRTKTYASVLRRMPAYYDVCQRALNVYKTYP